ncbi:MAG: hypothetical protein ACMXX9_03770 [Candidatus Woesearchaeota archaeon]
MSSELAEFKIFEKVVLKLYASKKFDELENLRKQALTNSEALKYYYICDILGISPEDKQLFRRGNDFLMILKEQEKELVDQKIKAENKKITGFLKEAENLLSQNMLHPPYCRGILIKYFDKFKDSGNQPVNKMEDSAVKTLFVNIYESYKNRQ